MTDEDNTHLHSQLELSYKTLERKGNYSLLTICAREATRRTGREGRAKRQRLSQTVSRIAAAA